MQKTRQKACDRGKLVGFLVGQDAEEIITRNRPEGNAKLAETFFEDPLELSLVQCVVVNLDELRPILPVYAALPLHGVVVFEPVDAGSGLPVTVNPEVLDVDAATLASFIEEAEIWLILPMAPCRGGVFVLSLVLIAHAVGGQEIGNDQLPITLNIFPSKCLEAVSLEVPGALVRFLKVKLVAFRIAVAEEKPPNCLPTLRIL